MTPPRAKNEATQPQDENCWIEDTANRRYRLSTSEHDAFWFIKVYDGKSRIGYANCEVDDFGLVLKDICISDQAMRPEGWIMRLLRVFTGQCDPINYRGRGLGSALLRVIIDRAKSHGLHHVTVQMFPLDLGANPRLPDWYRRHGFTVIMNDASRSGTLKLTVVPTDGAPADT